MQVTNVMCCISFVFYIKPQPDFNRRKSNNSCISFVFYIKPQLLFLFLCSFSVVYLSFSTSNHNRKAGLLLVLAVVYLSFSTSNHNQLSILLHKFPVVYLSFSTSNHNSINKSMNERLVVYLSFSTSNHNSSFNTGGLNLLYIFRFLHQTTTVD